MVYKGKTQDLLQFDEAGHEDYYSGLWIIFLSISLIIFEIMNSAINLASTLTYSLYGLLFDLD